MVDGILLVDKPKGWTSFDVCHFIRKRFGVKKVGHTGTLDPIATGLLVIVLGKFTRLQEQFSQLDKVYEGVLELGAVTDTQDGDGRVIETKSWQHVTTDQIMGVASAFKETLTQVPPMFSAIKHEGKRLYKLARAGKEVPREPRPITIHRFEIRGIRLPEIKFLIHCSKGTYIRTIAHDFGQRLGTGAFLKELQRLKAGSFDLQQATTIEHLKQIEDRQQLRSLFYRYVGENCYVT